MAYTHLQLKHARCSGFGCLEWLFVLTSSFIMLAITALSIERFIVLSTDYYFNSTEPQNMTIDVSVTQSARFTLFLPETVSEQLCLTWTCTADFIFAVAFLINTCKSLLCYYGFISVCAFAASRADEG